MPEPTAFNHVGQCVVDLERATRFYVELLGFEVDRELELPDAVVSPFLGIPAPVGMKAVYLLRGNFQLELMRFDRPGNPEAEERVFNEPGLTHLSLSVDDLDGTLDRIEAYGGRVVTRFPGAAMVRDPDGQILELLPLAYHHQVEEERAARTAAAGRAAPPPTAPAG